MCVNLDPHDDAEGLATIPADARPPRLRSACVDLLSGDRHEWRVGGNYLRLPPGGAHVLAVR